MDHAEVSSTGKFASAGIISKGYGHGGPGVCLGDGQTEAEEVPLQCARGDSLRRPMLPYLTRHDEASVRCCLCRRHEVPTSSICVCWLFNAKFQNTDCQTCHFRSSSLGCQILLAYTALVEKIWTHIVDPLSGCCCLEL